MNLAWWIFLGGGLHFGILIAGALVPRVLDWKTALGRLDPLLRQLVWVHGAFIVLVIAGFGTLALALSESLAEGSPPARGLCGLIALFWGARLAVQLLLFDARPYLKTALLTAGYHGLTPVFALLTAIFTWAAVGA